MIKKKKKKFMNKIKKKLVYQNENCVKSIIHTKKYGTKSYLMRACLL